jgi:hypothetical protein
MKLDETHATGVRYRTWGMAARLCAVPGVLAGAMTLVPWTRRVIDNRGPALPAAEVFRGNRRFVRILIGAPFLIVFVGFVTDACGGLPVLRGARSPWAWLGGVAGLGTLYLLGEGAVGWVGDRDKVSDPFWKRVLHLIALLSVWGIFLIAFAIVIMLVT